MPTLRHFLGVCVAAFVCVVYFHGLHRRFDAEAGALRWFRNHHSDQTSVHHSHSHKRNHRYHHHRHHKKVLPARRIVQPSLLEQDPKETMADLQHQDHSHPDFVKEIGGSGGGKKAVVVLPEATTPKEAMVGGGGGGEDRHGRHRKKKDDGSRKHDEDLYYAYPKDLQPVVLGTDPMSTMTAVMRDITGWVIDNAASATPTETGAGDRFLRGRNASD
eukprot:CAMPEP_0197197578 /NCGR_PEP_ID=MMETSP1423-20130617/32940_1 /TAXON_ID=476441 /ORGANISM="Pseudo-nitzschia heimii, Strain UNC1101" /LENGTH=216 /DNA_ID=CAMNT_0042651403 /DNA_START=11 /DNA_END=661 /DNA_ORIENTATION=+